jgi:hypothetical protein
MHRIAHHNDIPRRIGKSRFYAADRLIWLYDIHLLAEGLSAPEWARFVDLAAEKGMREICLDGLRSSRERFATTLPETLMGQLQVSGDAELSALHLGHGLLRRRLSDLRSLRSWRQRLVILREWTVPPADYMLRRYGVKSRWLLPYLYTRRAVAGVRKMLGFHRAPD